MEMIPGDTDEPSSAEQSTHGAEGEGEGSSKEEALPDEEDGGDKADEGPTNEERRQDSGEEEEEEGSKEVRRDQDVGELPLHLYQVSQMLLQILFSSEQQQVV